MKENLCLVEDDPTIGELVSKKLRMKGYRVDVFTKAEEVNALLWDLYIVDILLEGKMTGLDLCQKIKQQSPSVPLLLLSALSEPTDRIEGLRTGADDYLTKPFEMEELILRIQGMLKRRAWYRSTPAVYRWENNEMNFENLEGRRDGKTFQLSQREAMVLKVLIEREGTIVTRDEMLDKIWGTDTFPTVRTVDNFILRLRKYFESSSSHPRHIHSVRGMGYKFTKSLE